MVAVGRATFAWSVWTCYLDADGGKLSYYAARDVQELLDLAFLSGFLLITVSAAVFLGWLWRTRVNAELGFAPQLADRALFLLVIPPMEDSFKTRPVCVRIAPADSNLPPTCSAPDG